MLLKWIALFLCIVVLAFCFVRYGFAPFASEHAGRPTLDAKTYYKPSDVRPILERLGEFRPAYLRQAATIDMVYPLLYGFMFVILIVTLAPAAQPPRWLLALPIAGVVADYIENFTVIALLKRYPGDLGALPWIASVASAVKGTALTLSILAVAVLGIMWLVRRLR